MIRQLLASKRFISGLLTFVLAVSTITVIKADAIQPNQDFNVSIADVEGARGDIVDVPVTINAPTSPIDSYQMEVDFDNSKVEVTNITPKYGTNTNSCGNDEQGCFVSNFNNTEGWLKTVWVDSNGGSHPITSEKTLFIVQLKLKADAPLGSTKLEINKPQQGSILFSGVQGQEISPVTISGGTLTITPASGSDVREVPVVLEDGTQAAKVEIVRTTEKDGKKKDAVIFNEKTANDTIDQATKTKNNTATIVVAKSEKGNADFTEVGIKKEAVTKLSEKNININIQTEKAAVEVPINTVKQLEAKGEDLYFRIEEVKDPASQKKTEELIKQADPSAKPVSIPVEVETNFNGHTKVIVPLNQADLPTDKTQLADYLKTLAVHIQHSDGEIKVDKGEIVYDKNGNPMAMAVWVDKFSTFTIIGKQSPIGHKEIGYIQVQKRINLWTRDEFNHIHFSKILNPGAVYKVYSIDELHGGQYAIGGGAWITNMNSYVRYRSIAQYGATAAVFPRGPKNEIGYVTITKPMALWKRENNGKLTFVRALKKGETYRVYYSTLNKYGESTLGLGGGLWITPMWDHINFKMYE